MPRTTFRRILVVGDECVQIRTNLRCEVGQPHICTLNDCVGEIKELPKLVAEQVRDTKLGIHVYPPAQPP